MSKILVFIILAIVSVVVLLSGFRLGKKPFFPTEQDLKEALVLLPPIPVNQTLLAKQWQAEHTKKLSQPIPQSDVIVKAQLALAIQAGDMLYWYANLNPKERITALQKANLPGIWVMNENTILSTNYYCTLHLQNGIPTVSCTLADGQIEYRVSNKGRICCVNVPTPTHLKENQNLLNRILQAKKICQLIGYKQKMTSSTNWGAGSTACYILPTENQ